jgi:hypothetical protein
MIFKFGSFSHPVNEINLASFSQRRIFNGRAKPDTLRKTMILEGVFIGASASTITSAINARQTAYLGAPQDAGLYLDDGTTPTSHVLDSSDSETGVNCIAFDFPEGSPAEYATGRKFRVELQADYLDDEASEIVAYKETVSFQGTGGPRIIWVENDTAAPVAQQVSAYTPVYAQQSGFCVGRTDYLTVPNPYWPDYLDAPTKGIANSTPDLAGTKYRNYERRWDYKFIFPGAPALITLGVGGVYGVSGLADTYYPETV